MREPDASSKGSPVFDAGDINSDLARLLSERERIDRALLEQHSKTLTVLFTDIVGSTATFEAKGDIEGLRRVHAHNRALFPLVESHGGRVVKTIGDAIMAVFDNATQGALCAIEMQRRLRALSQHEIDPIEIRAGLHHGVVIVDGGDVFGDTVNTAARVASHAQSGEVWVTATLFENVDDDRLQENTREALAFKGKADKVSCVRLVVFDDEERLPSTSDEVLVVECVRARDGLRIAVIDGTKEKGTVKQHEEQSVDDGKLQGLSTHFRALAHGGGQSESYLAELHARGRDLGALAFGPRATWILTSTEINHLRLHVDDNLVNVPWELADLGQGFFCTKFAMGRMVSATYGAPTRRPLGSGDTLVVVSNPTGDLAAASREGTLLTALMRESGAQVQHLDGNTTKDAVIAAIANASVLHFAGHATHDDKGTALMCADGPLRTRDLRAALVHDDQTTQVPGFLFVNACHAGSDAWAPGAFAQEALNVGVEHFLAPTWEVPDDDALFFALRFWESALFGVSFGESARRARNALARDYARPLSFAGYVLYGDPRRALDHPRRRVQAKSIQTRSERSGEFEVLRRQPGAGAPERHLPAAAPHGAKVPPPPTEGTPPSPEHAAKKTAPPKPNNNGKALVFALLTGAVAAGVGAIVLAEKSPEMEAEASNGIEAVAHAAAAVAPAAEPAAKAAPTGRVAVSVLPFKNATGEAALDPLRDGMMEAAVTSLANIEGTRLIERGQLDLDINELEFSNSAYVDPKTRAALGRIVGAEVVVMGTTVASAKKLRAMARLVHVETGEVLGTAQVEGDASDLFALQDAMGAALHAKIATLPQRLRAGAK